MRRASRDGRFVIPVTVDDLAANGLLGEDYPQMCWERSVETLTARKDDIAGLAVASDERIEAYILYVNADADDGDCVAPLVRRGRWSPSEATALSTPRARHEDLPVPEGPPGGDLEGVPGDARFPPRRRASALRSEGQGLTRNERIGEAISLTHALRVQLGMTFAALPRLLESEAILLESVPKLPARSAKRRARFGFSWTSTCSGIERSQIPRAPTGPPNGAQRLTTPSTAGQNEPRATARGPSARRP